MRVLRLGILAVILASVAMSLSAQELTDSSHRPDPLAVGLVTVLDGARLRAAGIHTLADALRNVAGIAVAETGAFAGGTATPSAFAGGAPDVLVRWDGIPLGDRDAPLDLSHVTLDDVDRIEVRGGAAADLAGAGAATAVIDVYSGGAGSRPTVGVELAGGESRTTLARGEAAWSRGPWALSFGGSRLGTDGGIVPGERYSRWAGGATVSVLHGTDTFLRLSARHSRATYDFPSWDIGVELPPPNTIPDLDQVQRSSLTTVSLQGRLALGRRLALRVGLGRDLRSDRYHRGDVRDNWGTLYEELRTAEFTRTHAAASISYRATEWMTATLGVEQDEGDGSGSQAFRPADPLSAVGQPGRWSYHTYWSKGRSLRGAVAVDRGPLSLVADVRRDFPRWASSELTWRVLAAWRALAGSRVHVGARRGFRSPQIGAADWVSPGEALQDQTSRTLEVGYDQALAAGRLHVGVSLLEQRLDDFIAYYPVPTSTGFGGSSRNVGTARARGWELALRATPSGAVLVEAAWSHLPAKAVASPLPPAIGEFQVGAPLVDRAADLVTVGTSLGIGRDGLLDVRARHVGPRFAFRTAAFSRDTLPAYMLVDIGGRVPVVAGLALTFRVDNLFDTRYVERLARDYQGWAGFPGRRRAIVAGVRLRLP